MKLYIILYIKNLLQTNIYSNITFINVHDLIRISMFLTTDLCIHNQLMHSFALHDIVCLLSPTTLQLNKLMIFGFFFLI